MSRGRTIEAEAQVADPELPESLEQGFGAEFRELARQRRFVRESDAASTPAADAPAPPAWEPMTSSTIVPPRRVDAAPSTPRHSVEHVEIPTPARAASAPAAAPVAPAVTAAPIVRAPRASQRISEDQRAMLAELARMSDRLVESREALALATERADRAEATVKQSNLRFMAARALVLDAQETTRTTAERCAWLEARCETLEQALEVAVNASWLTRWRWRREAARTASV